MARLIAVKVGSRGRNPVLGVDEPTAANTGLLTDESALTTVNTLTTVSTSNQTISNMRYRERVVMASNLTNVTFENCLFEGGGSAPGDGSGLVECKNPGISGILFRDCKFKPRYPHWNWDSALVGHGFTALRCDMGFCTDIINVFNTNEPNGDQTAFGFPNIPKPYNSNVVIQQCYIHDVVYWTASSNNVVHPTDIATHNDAIQHQGGLGTQILGNAIWGVYARQHGHWVETSTSLAATDIVEPYDGVALNSLPAGAPWFGGPYQASTNGNTIPDTNTGTDATGRYNTGGQGSLAAIMFGDEVGPSGNLVVNDNWFYGGDQAFNGGGAVNRDYPGGPLGLYTMEFRRNKFDRKQGLPVRSTVSNSTHTISFQQGEDSWQGGVVTAPTTGGDANLNMNGTAITVRL